MEKKQFEQEADELKKLCQKRKQQRIEAQVAKKYQLLARQGKFVHENDKVNVGFIRQSKYDPDYCDIVAKMTRNGSSKTQIAAKIGVNVNTLERWRKSYPEFDHAMDLGKVQSQAWWENQMQEGIWDQNGRRMNTALVGMIMKNRYPDDYNDKQEVKHTFSVEDLLNDIRSKNAKEKELRVTPALMIPDDAGSTE